MLPDTTPIENLVDNARFLGEYMRFSCSLGRPRNLVALHRQRLGRQTTCIQTGDHRMWVWVRPTWTVFVGNAKGICFEVPEGSRPAQAWKAWREYVQSMACQHCGGSQFIMDHCFGCDRLRSCPACWQ